MQQSGDNIIQELDKAGIKMSTNLSMSISTIENPNLRAQGAVCPVRGGDPELN